MSATPRVAAAPSLVERQNVIYGEDDRRDLYAVKDPRLKCRAKSTVVLVRPSKIVEDGAISKLKTDVYDVCPKEAFSDQRTLGFCSGALVADDVILTAGHCVSKGDEGRVVFAFDFAVDKADGKTPAQLPTDNLYQAKEVLHSVIDRSTGADWALVRLDRKVIDRAPLKVNKGEGAPKDTPVTVIGHPWGLPTKVAGGAAVRDAGQKGYFVANLDTYGGNSGSSVFNNETGLIEGVLVRGATDWVTDPSGCTVSNHCPDDGCGGEEVTKIREVLQALEEAQKDETPAARGRSGSFSATKISRALYAQVWRIIQDANYVAGPEENTIVDRAILRPEEIQKLPKLFREVARKLQRRNPGALTSEALAARVTQRIQTAFWAVAGETVSDKRFIANDEISRMRHPDARRVVRMAIEDVYGVGSITE
ncbi:MAG: trypsin-like peptidase domain-containing protein [Myxococcota bacterium]